MEGKLDFKLDIYNLEERKQMKVKLNKVLGCAPLKTCYIKARHPTNKEWMKGRVLANRISKYTNALTPKAPRSYDYYIRFEDQDKRSDCWLSYQDIKQTSEAIVETNFQEIFDQLKDLHPNDNPHFGLRMEDLEEHEWITQLKKIEKIRIRKYQVPTWYYSPFPPQFNNIETLYFCQFCLSFFCHKTELIRHDQRCELFHPPGNEIYRDEEKKIAIFQVDGQKSKIYCQNLGYLSKLFLDHKSLKHDMSIFLFYILCQIEDNQYHIAGYFSKCKESANNLSCILVLPFYQRKGYGKLMINFSYELSLIDEKVGSPEKPLSDLGRQTYLSFWIQRIIEVIIKIPLKQFTVALISKKTAISEEDIKWTLCKCNLIKIVNEKIILCFDQTYLKNLSKTFGKPAQKIDLKKLHYVAYRSETQFWINDAKK